MPVNVDPKNDYAFKAVFGSSRHTRVLIHLLNAILEPCGLRLHSVRILNPLSEIQELDDKKLILDVKASDELGRLYNIEMQMVPAPSFPGRFLYYWARWYEPATGRFNRLDPFFGNTSDPVSLHKYLYAHGDPANGIDPSGRFFGIGSVFAGSTIASHLAQIEAFAGEYIAESISLRRHAWEFFSLSLAFAVVGMAARPIAHALTPVAARAISYVDDLIRESGFLTRLGSYLAKLTARELAVLRLFKERFPERIVRAAGDDAVRDLLRLPTYGRKMVDFLSQSTATGKLILTEAKGNNLATAKEQLESAVTITRRVLGADSVERVEAAIPSNLVARVDAAGGFHLPRNAAGEIVEGVVLNDVGDIVDILGLPMHVIFHD